MDPINLIIVIAFLCGFGWGSWIVINKFFPEPMKTPCLVIVGVILLIMLVYVAQSVLPGMSGSTHSINLK